jgi:hypothetical protein
MNLLTGTVILSLAFGGGHQALITGDPSPADGPPPRIRSEDAGVADAMRQALLDSATFRRLAVAIHETDGIIYVRRGRCGGQVTGCTQFAAVSGPNRILHVTIDAGTTGLDVGTIAHELQHALEVLGNPNIRSAEGMVLFYMVAGRAALMNSRFRETPAAIAAGQHVRAELREAARATGSQAPNTEASDVTAVTVGK